MWQEICGKKEITWRFILPSFFDGNLEREMIKLLGRFRWEMCRRIEGVYWNDIQYKSLTRVFRLYNFIAIIMNYQRRETG